MVLSYRQVKNIVLTVLEKQDGLRMNVSEERERLATILSRMIEYYQIFPEKLPPIE